MAIQGDRTVTIQLTQDIKYTQSFPATANPDSPGQIQIIDLASGNNTITVPTDETVGALIIPPSDNDVLLKLKGINGDTGIPIHNTDPLSLTILPTTASFVLNAADAVVGLRIIWT